jgi:hypothetical protein
MYAFEQDVPINAEIHQRIIEGLGTELPSGLLIHLALENPDGTLRYIDVWDSQEDCDRFTEERLHPVVGQALRDAGVHPNGEPPRRQVQVAGMWGPVAVEPKAI